MDKMKSDKFSRIFYDDAFLSDLGKYLNAKKQRNNPVNFLTEKKFTIKDTDSSYRVINHWSSLGLFDDQRVENKGWRKFNLVDMVWLRVLMELRTFGLSLDKMKAGYQSLNEKAAIFEFGIASCMMRRGMNLIVFSDGHVEITSNNAIAVSESISYLKETSYLIINLNRCLERIFPSKDFSPRLNTVELSEKEISVLAELRISDPNSVNIFMKNGDLNLMEVKTTYKEDISKLSDILNSVAFGEFTLKKEDGKIVYIEKTKKIKL